MEKMLLHRRETIILTSIDVINEFGIQGFSTREVAKRQGISEGTIFKHFRTKNELMLAILDHYSQFDNDILESIKLKNLKSKEAITYFIKAYAEYYENYPQITVIMQIYDVLSYEPELEKSIKDIFLKRSKTLQDLIERAQESGEINKSIDSEKLSDIIGGSFRTICLKWRFSGYAFPLKENILSTLRVILDAFSDKDE